MSEHVDWMDDCVCCVSLQAWDERVHRRLFTVSKRCSCDPVMDVAELHKVLVQLVMGVAPGTCHCWWGWRLGDVSWRVKDWKLLLALL